MTESLSFFGRLRLAWVCCVKILANGDFAATVSARTRALPERARVGRVASPKRSAKGRARGATARIRRAEPSGHPAPDPASALQLLALLQREGRLLDFLQQDLSGHADAEIGAVARVVHDSCQRALSTYLSIGPVRAESEGATVTLTADYDADQVLLTGNVAGSAPYQGVLRHRGWRVDAIDLPQRVAHHDPKVLAPAEVEL